MGGIRDLPEGMGEIMVTDALGKEIEIGAVYGYSNRGNGIVRVVVGRALKVTEKGNVTLEILHRGYAAYGAPIQRETGIWGNLAKSSCLANSLFRLEDPPVVKWGS